MKFPDIIPTCNRNFQIKSSIYLELGQVGIKLKIIVVDDGSMTVRLMPQQIIIYKSVQI